LYKLDTSVGGSTDPILGSDTITIANYDGTVNANVAQLSYGDWIMIGHPVLGEVFRVSNLNPATKVIQLGTVSDPSVQASLSFTALQHSTHNVQKVTFTGTNLLSGDVGFRLRFKNAITFVTQAGGDYGCMRLSSTPQAIQSELQRLLTIDEVVVSNTTSSTSITFTITFTGSLVRGTNEVIQVIDVGSNGCTSIPQGINVTQTTAAHYRHSFVPVYRLETTKPLAYNCEPKEVKDALESLNMINRVDVEKSVEFNGYSWMITFRGLAPETSYNIPQLYMNSVNIKAAISGNANVYSVYEHIVDNLSSGHSYFFEAAAVNSYGPGKIVSSNPISKQPSDQVPSKPLNIKTRVGADSTLDVQFNSASYEGGQPISQYKLQVDYSSNFNSGPGSSPLAEITIPRSQISFRPDVQTLTITSTTTSFIPGGTFALSFLGQRTGDLDYNVTASGLKSALENLSNINTVEVYRELYCSQQVGQNACGNDQGYVWMITFVDVIDNGLQFEEYIDQYESHYKNRLVVHDEYLYQCNTTSPYTCDSKNDNDKTVAFVDSLPEVQDLCLCSTILPLTLKVLDQESSIPASATLSASSITTALHEYLV